MRACNSFAHCKVRPSCASASRRGDRPTRRASSTVTCGRATAWHSRGLGVGGARDSPWSTGRARGRTIPISTSAPSSASTFTRGCGRCRSSTRESLSKRRAVPGIPCAECTRRSVHSGRRMSTRAPVRGPSPRRAVEFAAAHLVEIAFERAQTSAEPRPEIGACADLEPEPAAPSRRGRGPGARPAAEGGVAVSDHRQQVADAVSATTIHLSGACSWYGRRLPRARAGALGSRRRARLRRRRLGAGAVRVVLLHRASRCRAWRQRRRRPRARTQGSSRRCRARTPDEAAGRALGGSPKPASPSPS